MHFVCFKAQNSSCDPFIAMRWAAPRCDEMTTCIAAGPPSERGGVAVEHEHWVAGAELEEGMLVADHLTAKANLGLGFALGSASG